MNIHEAIVALPAGWLVGWLVAGCCRWRQQTLSVAVNEVFTWNGFVD